MLIEGLSDARAGTRMCRMLDKAEWGKRGGTGRGEHDFGLVAASHHVKLLCPACCVLDVSSVKLWNFAR